MRFSLDELQKATGGRFVGEAPRAPLRDRHRHARPGAEATRFSLCAASASTVPISSAMRSRKAQRWRSSPEPTRFQAERPGLVVDDTLRAYMALASAARIRSSRDRRRDHRQHRKDDHQDASGATALARRTPSGRDAAEREQRDRRQQAAALARRKRRDRRRRDGLRVTTARSPSWRRSPARRSAS